MYGTYKLLEFVYAQGASYSVENCSIVPNIKPDLDIFIINLYTEFHYNMYILCGKKRTETANKKNFSTPKGHNSVENCLIVPNFT